MTLPLRSLLFIAIIGSGSCANDGKATPTSPLPDPAPAPPAPDEGAATAAYFARIIGPLARVRADLRPLFVAGDDFSAMPKPAPGDWLAEHRERGQTFAEFKRSRPNIPTPERNTIYLLPIGKFDASPPLTLLARFVRIYYTLPVSILPAVSIARVGATQRDNSHTGQRQLLSTDILTYLSKRVPADAYALIALTETDLYPEPSWNFVFGQASLRERVGVYSFARYHPDSAPSVAAAREIVLRRSLKVMVHEIGHMFGIHHCIFFSCLMNGSNHMAESDSQPLHLCPLELRKLHHSVGFDPRDRYRELASFYSEVGFTAEAEFVAGRAAQPEAPRAP